jgi:histidinol-phosphate aminotransferase
MSKEQALKLLRKGISHLEGSSAGLSLDEVKRKYNLTEIIKLASNENPLGPSPKAVEVGREMAAQMSVYPDPSGYNLRAAIASAYGVTWEQVLHGSGSSELITFIGAAFINQGDESIIPKPTYHRYQEITQIMGGENLLVPLKDYRVDLAEMAQRLSPRTKLIVIANPNNPTGDIVRQKEVEVFLKAVGKDRIVIFDEAYGEFVDDPAYPRALEFISQGYAVIVLRTFSKVYALAGARVGYAISSPDIIKYLNRVRANFNVNRIGQMAAIAALSDREHFRLSTQMVWEGRQFYYDKFQEMGLFYLPTWANFIFVKVGPDDMKVHEALVRKGVILRPMTPWGYKGFIRVTIGTHDQNKKVVSALEKSISEVQGA